MGCKMESRSPLLMLFIVVVVAAHLQVSGGCLEEERIGLLRIKEHFSSNKQIKSSSFASWIGLDCCNWDRVICNNLTSGAHVVDLFLHSSFSSHNPLNVSLFQTFTQLNTLDLSKNWFSNLIHNQVGFNRLTSLKKLMLSGNSLKGVITLHGLKSLRELDLSWNHLNGALQMQGIAKLKSLEFFDFSHNYYQGRIIPLQDMKNLKVLNLTYNWFNGPFLIEGFCEAINLVEFNIGQNDISGQLPECIGNLSKLTYFDISNNRLSGKIPSTISNLTSIESLYLAGNDFEGPFSLSSLANYSKLKYLMLSGAGNDIKKVRVETEERPEWHPTFQLEVLVLHNCILNRDTSFNIPTFLLSQHELKLIDISHNQLVGSFPLWLLHNNTKLEYLDLSHNSFTGSLQLPIIWKHNLSYLQISGNKFSGELPNHLGLSLPQINYFNLSRNSFEGNLPPSMHQMKNLRWLDLSSNQFDGNLQISMFNNLSNLECLRLASNNFSGGIEDGIQNNTLFRYFDISNNMISGEIPIWIGSLEGLRFVNMSNNLFAGELPREICFLPNLILLDVSQNQLFGGLPTCFSPISLVYLFMQGNYLSGPMPRALLSTASSLKILDLSFNNFSGNIPDWLGKFESLRVLLLKGNELHGPIPQELCQVGEISIMDLSNNKLTGSIPSCLNNITFGEIEATLTFKYDIEAINAPVSLPFDDITYYCLISGAYTWPLGQFSVDFTAKHRVESYKSYILDHMSGLDLSSNKLTGKIPQQIGHLLKIHALNFSHNRLAGPIPKEFSNLEQIESLDLSNNLLSGAIPAELGELNWLAIFNVSYNNLSGMIPLISKLASYPESSYYGNPYLRIGPLVEDKYPSSILPTGHGVFIDLEAFFGSFIASYIIILLGLAAVLYISPRCRLAWFCFIEDCCYYISKCI